MQERPECANSPGCLRPTPGDLPVASTIDLLSCLDRGAIILIRMKRSAAQFGAGAFVALALASAQALAQEPTSGAAFQCDNGGRLVLSFMDSEEGLSALIWLQGASYKLAHQPPARGGPPRVVWSDGEHSLTWSSGVRLMWMSGSTHLMCGRGGHRH
jgi:hypothetical protein